MTAVATVIHDVPGTSPTTFLHWRSQVLRHRKVRRRLAWDFAADGDIDLHDLLNRIDLGCLPYLAA